MEFITAEDKLQLEKKLEKLTTNRPILSNRIAEARAHGDLKENAEYHAAREAQGMAEAEIRRLEQRLKSSHVATDSEIPEGMVFLGSVVRLRDTNDNSDDVYKIVGELSGTFDSDEIEITAGSPMGEAILKTRIGDKVNVDLPRGQRQFEVMEIL